MLSALAMLQAYADRRTSPVEIIRAALAAIETDNPRINAWVHVAADAALQDAAASETRWSHGSPRGLLDGVPVGIKDLLAVTGQPMRRGSPAYPPDFMPAEDSPIVARLRAAGAILIGKTATPDSGCKIDTTSLVHGTTRNPHNPALTAGGSSGGAAGALALGHVPIAIGTDGAGSIRIPAAYCGVFGLKPSTGRIPAPPGPFWPHAVTGPLSRTVLDTALAWNVVTQPDPATPTPCRPPRPTGSSPQKPELRACASPSPPPSTASAPHRTLPRPSHSPPANWRKPALSSRWRNQPGPAIPCNRS